jgi:hypothetical protein
MSEGFLIPPEVERILNKIKDEEIYYINNHTSFFPSAHLLEETPAVTIISNKRIICIIKEYEGIFSKNFKRYLETPFIISYKDVIEISFSDVRNDVIKITSVKNNHQSGSDVDGIGFGDQAGKVYDLINDLIKIEIKKTNMTESEIAVMNYIKEKNYEIKLSKCSNDLSLSLDELQMIINSLKKKDLFDS